jgi:hypothetical protein
MSSSEQLSLAESSINLIKLRLPPPLQLNVIRLQNSSSSFTFRFILPHDLNVIIHKQPSLITFEHDPRAWLSRPY